MTTLRKAGNLLYFSKLDVSPEPVNVFSIGWYFKYDSDWWKNFVLRFKSGDKQFIKDAQLYFIDGVYKILILYKLDSYNVGLVSAIPHDKSTLLVNSPLSQVGKFVSDETGV